MAKMTEGLSDFWQKMKSFMHEKKEDIVRHYNRMRTDTAAQEEAYREICKKFGLTENFDRGEITESFGEEISGVWEFLLRTIFGVGFYVGVLTLAVLLVAAQMFTFTWLFASLARGVIATILAVFVEGKLIDKFKIRRR